MLKRPRRSQAARSASAQAALVAAATAALTEVGFARATTAAIAERAGVSTGALHHHFASKEDLFIAVLDEATGRVLTLFENLSEERPAKADLSTTIIQSLWTVYGGMQYWAVWEINIGWRSDKVWAERAITHREASRDRIYAAIRDNPALTQHTKEGLLELYPFILAVTRGMFLETFSGRSEPLLAGQLEILAELLKSRLVTATAQPKRAVARAR